MSDTGSGAFAHTHDLGKHVLRSGAALSVSRIICRLLDLVRTLVIARMLGPDQMGVYSIATLVLAALDQFSETGLTSALIRRRGNVTEFVLPIRTVQLFRGIILGMVLYCLAPWIGLYFKSPSAVSILRIMALTPVIKGFEPLFLTLAKRELHFLPVVYLQVLASAIGLLVGLISAYHRPDAWALVWATLTTVGITMIGAHVLSPRSQLGMSFDWRPLSKLKGFGFWIFVNSLASYLFTRSGDWAIGRILDASVLALYQMSFLICTLATGEIGNVVSQIAFPVYSHLQEDSKQLLRVFRESFGLLTLATIAIAGIVCACSDDFYRLILGEKWLGGLSFVPWISVWGVCSVLAGTLNGLFYAINRPRLWAWTVFGMCLFLLAGIYPMTRLFGPVGVAILMATIGVLTQVARYYLVAAIFKQSQWTIFRNVAYTSAACIISVYATSILRRHLTINPFIGIVFSFFSQSILFIVMLWLGRAWLIPSPSELFRRLQSILRYKRS
jgi:O-antigen/teichoic acid export membrane protein